MSDAYLLPRTDAESRRLMLQSELLREATELTLARVELPVDCSCLDVGCGTGDALPLIADRGGPGGRYVGLDVDASLAAPLIESLAGAGRGRFEVAAGAVFSTEALPGAPYDLVFSRYLLHHLDDPVAAISWMWDQVAPGGTLVVMDIDSRDTRTYPVWAPYLELEGLIREVFVATGIDNFIGHKLPHYVARSAAGAPDGTSAIGAVRSIPELAEFLDLLVSMIGDKAVEVGVATVERVASLRAAIQTAPEQVATYCWRPACVGVWKRKPAGP